LKFNVGEIKVYTTLGELVFSDKLETINYELDLRGKSKGVYFVKIVADDKTYSQKIIIQ